METPPPRPYAKSLLTNLTPFDRIIYVNAGIAQLVERRIRNA